VSKFDFDAAMEAIGHHDHCTHDADSDGPENGWCYRARKQALQRLEATIVPENPTLLIPESEAIDKLWAEIRHLRGYAGILVKLKRLVEEAEAPEASVGTAELTPLLDLVDPGIALTQEEAAFIANELRERDFAFPFSAVKDQRQDMLRLLYGRPTNLKDLAGEPG
jgi:hypothetical protein